MIISGVAEGFSLMVLVSLTGSNLPTPHSGALSSDFIYDLTVARVFERSHISIQISLISVPTTQNRIKGKS